MGQLLKQSTLANVTILMVDSLDHVTGKTGLTLAIYASKAAGTPVLITPTVTELDSTNVKGLYKLALTTGHTDTLGELQLHVTAAGADPTDVTHQVALDLPGVSQTGDAFAVVKAGGAGDAAAIKTQTDKMTFTVTNKIDANALAVAGTTQTARDLGLALPAVAPGTNGGLPTTNGTKLNQTADLTAGQKIAATVASADVSGNLPADLKAITAGVDLSAAMKASVTTAATAATPTATISVGTGAGQLNSSGGKVPATLAATDVTGNVPAQVKGQDNIDFGALQKTSLNAATPASVGSVTAGVTVTTNNDKTGYALSVAGVQAIWDALTTALVTVGSIGKRIADFLTGDAFARLGVAGAGLTALGDARIAHLDADISSRNATTPPSTAAIAAAVVDQTLSGHTTAGTVGGGINAAGSAGDPWATTLPGAYAAGSAGKIIGDNIDTVVSSRSSHSPADVWAVGTRTLTSFGTLVADIATAVWATATRTLSAFAFTPSVTVSDKTGFALTSGEHTNIAADAQTGLTAQGYTAARAVKVDNLDAAITTRTKPADTQAAVTDVVNPVTAGTVSDKTGYALAVVPPTASEVAAAVWGAGVRTLTSFGSLVADVTSAVWAAAVRTLTAFGFPATLAASQPDYAPAKASDLPAAPDNAGIAAIKAKTDNLPATPADQSAVPTTDQIILAMYARKVTHDTLTGEFIIWDAAGTSEVLRLTPTSSPTAVPIIGMRPSV